MTIELAKELISERLDQKNPETGWFKEYYNSDDAFYAYAHKSSLLPNRCGEHYEDVWHPELHVRCNSIWFAHFNLSECLTIDGMVAVYAYKVVGRSPWGDDDERAREADSHAGEIYVSFQYPVSVGDGEVWLDDSRGKDLTLDELAEQHPEFLKELVFHLR